MNSNLLNIKRIFIVLLALSLSSETYSQWQWSRHLGGSDNLFSLDIANSLLSDGTNFYLTGSYSWYLILPGDTLDMNGPYECYIVKFNETGGHEWSRNFGSPTMQYYSGETSWGVLSVDKSSIYLSGFVADEVLFGSQISSGLASATYSDIFLAKVDVNGNFMWARRYYGLGYDEAQPYVIGNSKIVLVARANSAMQFNGINVNAGGSLVQFDSSGVCNEAFNQFTGSIGGNLNDVKLVSFDDDFIFFGSFMTSNFEIDTAVLTNFGFTDAFISRTDSTGSLKWIKQFGYTGDDYIRDLVLDDENNMFVTGSFSDSISFDNVTLYSAHSDMFIAKLDSNGNYLWARQLNSTDTVNSGYKLAMDQLGSVYVTGTFSGTASFGNYLISATTSSDMFLARFDTSGYCLGVKHFGQAEGTGVVVDDSGDVVVSGNFTNTITIGTTSYTSYGGKDIFLAKADAITGIEEERTGQEQLLIYANPSRGTCQVSIPESLQQEKNLILRLYDNKGTLIEQQEVQMKQGTLKLSLNAQAKGMYHVTLGNGKKQYSGKVVFE